MADQAVKSVSSANYSVEPFVSHVNVTTGNTTRTITLPDATAPRRVKVIQIRKADSGTGFVKVVGVNSQTIDGKASHYINLQYQTVNLVSDGSNWAIVSRKEDVRSTENGASVQIQQISEEISLAAAATTDSVANLLPANSLILAVVGRVTVTTTTTATFSVGDATTAARFASGVAIAAGTQFSNAFAIFNPANTNAQGPVQGAAAPIRITPNAQPGDANGKIRVTVFYISLNAPAS